MINDDTQTYYDVLEIAPDAAPQEIRVAYLRSKAAYKKDSVAIYSLMSPEETENLLARIEEAYHVLSSPEKRREYDRRHGLLTVDESPISAPPRGQKVVSIDRVPPMESMGGDSDLLVPPSTDFTAPLRNGQAASAGASYSSSIEAVPGPFDNPVPRASQPQAQAPRQAAQAPVPAPMSAPTSMTRHSSDRGGEQAMVQEIAQEVEWRGTFLRRVREARNVSIEELCDYTKITRTYIYAIEDENFDKLPAAVYLRGFVVQMTRFLKLPSEKVAGAYMTRHAQWRLEKEKRAR